MPGGYVVGNGKWIKQNLVASDIKAQPSVICSVQTLNKLLFYLLSFYLLLNFQLTSPRQSYLLGAWYALPSGLIMQASF